ncbi:MAG: hypothetical protein ABMB14_15590 [Myxococcota bacterium]
MALVGWLWATGAAYADPALEIKEGTWELGGHATANITIDRGVTDLYLDLSPTVGYFVGRDLELLGGLSIYVHGQDVGVGFFGGVDYLFPTDGARPYLGGTVGYNTDVFTYGPYQYTASDVVTLSGRGGILLPLNRRVGLDLGVRVNLNIADTGTSTEIPLGYLGVRAFF